MRKLISLLIPVFLIFSAVPACSQEAPTGIQWFDWGKNAFDYAKKENKPILLYLTSSWCHWCHVMDAETFNDPEVITLVSRTFVPVRVNTDLRPDLNARYNVGGWPSTLFLTPEGNVLVGATFLSAAQMKSAIPEIDLLFRQKRDEFNQKALKELSDYDVFLKTALQESRDEDLAPSFIDKILSSVLLSADDELGGLGKADKTPVPEVTEFLFLVQEVRPDPKAEKMLKMFIKGEENLFDREMGGFFRYATKRDWSDPQYEKVLSTNAFLTRDFIWSSKVLNRPQDLEIVRSTLSYLDEFLLDKALGGFFGSQDADLFLITSGLSKKEETAVIPGTVYYSYSKAKRLELGTPAVDHHMYANSCSQMVISLLEAARKLDDEQIAKKALQALDFLMEVSFDSKSGMKHVFPEPEKSILVFEDQVWTLKALLAAYEYSRVEQYKIWMDALLTIVERDFGTNQGIFFDIAKDPDAIGSLQKREVPLVENCLMARIYIRLALMTGKEAFSAKARAILNFFAPRYQQFSYFAAAYGSALIDWFYSGLDVTVVGKKEDPKAKSLWQAVLALPSNRLRAQWLDPETDKTRIERLGIKISDGNSAAVICVGKRCLTPAVSATEVPIQFEVAAKLVQSGT